MSNGPPLAITPGEAAGIGPDLVLMLAARGLPHRAVVIADPLLLATRARTLSLDIELVAATPPYKDLPHAAGKLAVHGVALKRIPPLGQADPDNAPALLRTLDIAIDGCLDGTFSAMVTGPVNKGVIIDAGIPFTGHTEYIARRCKVSQPVMLLTGAGLRVALATTHLPLSAVSKAITRELIDAVVRALHRDLSVRFGCKQPRILVLGLNPHAGEQGHLGDEEVRTITPALDALRAQGFSLTGPIPADTAFQSRYLDAHDAVLAMYHDQGLPVLKFASFGHAVNVTLGLPIVRTSVDHGTAFDLAGKGIADTGSLTEALIVAHAMSTTH